MKNGLLAFSILLVLSACGSENKSKAPAGQGNNTSTTTTTSPREVCESKALAATDFAVYIRGNDFGVQLAIVKNVYDNGTAKIEVVGNKANLRDTKDNETKIVNTHRLSPAVSNCFGRVPTQKAVYKQVVGYRESYLSVVIVHVFADQMALVRMDDNSGPYTDEDYIFTNVTSVSPALQ